MTLASTSSQHLPYLVPPDTGPGTSGTHHLACSTENAIWHIVPTDHKGSVTWPSATRVCRPCTRLARHGVRHSRRRGASAAQKSRHSIRTPDEFRTNAAATAMTIRAAEFSSRPYALLIAPTAYWTSRNCGAHLWPA